MVKHSLLAEVSEFVSHMCKIVNDVHQGASDGSILILPRNGGG